MPNRNVATRAKAALRDYDWAKARDLPVSVTRGYNILREAVAEIERLQAIRSAFNEYSAALARREHGAVAADRFIRAAEQQLQEN